MGWGEPHNTPTIGGCSGIAASWCPNHGTCTCSIDRDTGDRYEDGDCPLHGLASDHPRGA